MLKRVCFDSVVCTLTYIFSLLLIFGVSVTVIANERSNNHFPHIPGSFWIYEDQDGNELTHYAVEKKEIEGEVYHAFNYESALGDWVDYDYHLHLNFCQVDEE